MIHGPIKREGGLSQIWIRDMRSGEMHRLEHPEEAYACYFLRNKVYDSGVMRFGYQSMISPSAVFDYDMETRLVGDRGQENVAVGDEFFLLILRDLVIGRESLVRAGGGDGSPVCNTSSCEGKFLNVELFFGGGKELCSYCFVLGLHCRNFFLPVSLDFLICVEFGRKPSCVLMEGEEKGLEIWFILEPLKMRRR